MMVRRAVFDRVGLLDEGYFLYYEETDFCLRARRAGWECWYVPASRVVHLVGQSSGVTDRHRPRGRRPAYWFASRRRYFERNHGPGYAALASAAWAAGFALWRARRRVQRKPGHGPGRAARGLRPVQLPGRRSGDRMSQAFGHELPTGDRDGNPTGVGFLGLLAEDFRTHDRKLLEQGFWAVAVHRFGNWRMGLPRWGRPPFTVAYKILFKWVEWTCGISLPYTVRLGRRVRLWHHGGMILNARSIGDDVHLRQNTTFGIARRGQEADIPVIGDRVDIGCGACVLGAVRVGSDSVVGANAVVLSDIPPRSVAVGAPARVVKTLPGPSPNAPLERAAPDE